MNINVQLPAHKRKGPDEIMTRRLLSSADDYLAPTLRRAAQTEITATLRNRVFLNPKTGCREFLSVVKEMDEIWRSLFNADMIQPHASRLPGDVQIIDDGIAKHNDETPGYSSKYYFFSFAQIKRQNQCWNCRGFGHLSACCPSETGGRNTEHVISTMHLRFSKRQQQTWQADRSTKAVPCNVEDDIAYDLSGVSLGSVTNKATEPHDHVVEVGITHDPLTTTTRWCTANEHQM